MKKLVLSACLFIFPISLFAISYNSSGGSPDKQDIVENWGETWATIKVQCSSADNILISSAAVSREGLGSNGYKYREIINTANSSLSIFPESTFGVFSSTYGIVLATATAGMGGGTWKTYTQGPIFGIWNAGCGVGRGAGGSEHW